MVQINGVHIVIVAAIDNLQGKDIPFNIIPRRGQTEGFLLQSLYYFR